MGIESRQYTPMILKLAFSILLTSWAFGCKDQYNPIEGDADFWIENIDSDPEFKALTAPNSAVYVKGGIGGIIIFRAKYEQAIDDFYAFDRACPHEGENTTKVVWSKDDPFYATCPKCGSVYNLVGKAIDKGPSEYPLFSYNCDFYGEDIHVY